jgi:hypothetical protein
MSSWGMNYLRRPPGTNPRRWSVKGDILNPFKSLITLLKRSDNMSVIYQSFGQLALQLTAALLSRVLRAAPHQLYQDIRQETQSCFIRDSSASWLRPVCGGFHTLIRFNFAPFFASCRRHRVLTHAGVRPTLQSVLCNILQSRVIKNIINRDAGFMLSAMLPRSFLHPG